MYEPSRRSQIHQRDPTSLFVILGGGVGGSVTHLPSTRLKLPAKMNSAELVASPCKLQFGLRLNVNSQDGTIFCFVAKHRISENKRWKFLLRPRRGAKTI
jgi:hypothetical protein